MSPIGAVGKEAECKCVLEPPYEGRHGIRVVVEGGAGETIASRIMFKRRRIFGAIFQRSAEGEFQTGAIGACRRDELELALHVFDIGRRELKGLKIRQRPIRHAMSGPQRDGTKVSLGGLAPMADIALLISGQ